MTIALIDANAFYCSAQILFEPWLRDSAVVVASNGDGCVVSRNDQAKALGIKMGQPVFELRDLEARNQVKIFSSNYSLYQFMWNGKSRTTCRGGSRPVMTAGFASHHPICPLAWNRLVPVRPNCRRWRKQICLTLLAGRTDLGRHTCFLIGEPVSAGHRQGRPIAAISARVPLAGSTGPPARLTLRCFSTARASRWR